MTLDMTAKQQKLLYPYYQEYTIEEKVSYCPEEVGHALRATKTNYAKECFMK